MNSNRITLSQIKNEELDLRKQLDVYTQQIEKLQEAIEALQTLKKYYTHNINIDELEENDVIINKIESVLNQTKTSDPGIYGINKKRGKVAKELPLPNDPYPFELPKLHRTYWILLHKGPSTYDEIITELLKYEPKLNDGDRKLTYHQVRNFISELRKRGLAETKTEGMFSKHFLKKMSHTISTLS